MPKNICFILLFKITAFKALLMLGEPNLLPVIFISYENNFFSVSFLFDHLLKYLHVYPIISPTK